MKKREDGLYVKAITVTVDGKKVRKSFYGKSVREVNRKIVDFTETTQRGRLFSDVADEWDTNHRSQVTENAHRMYAQPYQHAVGAFGEMPVKDIKPSDITSYIGKIASSGLSSRTIKGYLSLVSMIMDTAVVAGDIQYNPAKAVKPPKGKPAVKREAAEANDADLVMEHLKDPFGLYAYLLLFTGLRRAEALALRYEDIDREQGIIRIGRAVSWYNNQRRVKDPKTEAGYRDIHLFDVLAAAIPTDGSGYIFEMDDGGVLTQSAFKRRWEKYTKLSGINCTSHQLRHLHCSMLINFGVPPKVVQYLMGHASISVTMNIYTHIKKAYKKLCGEDVAAIMKYECSRICEKWLE